MDLQDERLLLPVTLGEALKLEALDKFVVAASAEDRALLQFLGVRAVHLYVTPSYTCRLPH